MMKSFLLLLLLCTLTFIHHLNAKVITYDDVRGKPYTVSSDERSITINGERTLLISAGMHYPRSTPSMWKQMMLDAKAGGVNTMQMYFFHNYHESTQGIWDWETESRNMGEFIQAAADAGLFVNLRIGPYVCAEWQYGGLPFWLHDQGFEFRDYNNGWLMYMERAMSIVVQYVQPYLARNGGPIIITQIENEYGNGNGDPNREAYLQWCSNLTVALATDTAWVMCQTSEIMKNIIYACNGDDCSDYVYNQQSVVKQPAMWTENWVGWFQHWGEAVPTRAASNVAYTVAHFIAAGGSYMNYYMYHGGTNFGRYVGGPNIVTSYDYDAPLDEYGLPHEPKFSHSMNLFNILFQYHDTIMDNPFSPPLNLGKNLVAHTYGTIGTQGSIAFLVNTGNDASSVTFQNRTYTLSGTSVQILDGVSLNSIYDTSVYANIPVQPPQPILPNATANTIEYINEPTSLWTRNPIGNTSPMEQLNLTHYKTIYLSYFTQIEVSNSQAGQKSVNLLLSNANDYQHVFVDGNYVAFIRGAGNPTNFSMDFSNVQAGQRILMILSITQGVNNGNIWNLACGLHGEVSFDGYDLTSNGWMHQVGLMGEYNQWFSSKGASTVQWTEKAVVNQPMTWYRLNITTPKAVGDPSRATWTFDMGGCGKGQLYANGYFLGAYWSIKQTNNPNAFSQQYYHMPRDYLAPEGLVNAVIIFEEMGCDPTTIRLLQRNATIVGTTQTM